jgi:hypothetical protein
VLPGSAPFAGALAPWKAEEAATAAGGRYGWLLPGTDAACRRAAATIAGAGVRVSVTTRDARGSAFAIPAGSYVVRREGNEDVRDLAVLVARLAAEAGAQPLPLESAATEDGPSLGSSTLLPVEPPRVVVLAGDGADVSGVAFLRLALERGLGLLPTVRRVDSLPADDLEGVTAIVVPNGNARFRRALLADESAETLRRFVDAGGVLVAIRGGAAALREKPLELSNVTAWEPPSDSPKAEGTDTAADAPAAPAPRAVPEAPPASPEAALERDLERRALPIPGAALRTQGMPGHPLLFGLAGSPAFLVVDGEPPLRLPEARANVVTVAPDEPLLSGFGWKEALERWKGAAVVQLEEVGRGRVVSFAADPVFRGVWRGSETVFLNAVLLGPSLGSRGQ